MVVLQAVKFPFFLNFRRIILFLVYVFQSIDHLLTKKKKTIYIEKYLEIFEDSYRMVGI